MEGKSDVIFEEQTNSKIPEQDDNFAVSCQPLSGLLDSVRDIEGFPLGKDEDILALSDPPYYTACPNPYINAFIEKYGKPYDETTDTYEKTPFVSDVSEGKYDPLYKFHAYPTKVPYRAIKSYIEHYTNRKEIVLDGFCGTGMTAIAAQLSDRKAIILDLAPAATRIAASYNMTFDFYDLDNAFRSILKNIREEYDKYYTTLHGNNVGRINYVVWSNVYMCPYCKNESSFWDFAVDYWGQINSGRKNGIVSDRYSCRYCNARNLKKSNLIMKINNDNGKIVQIPVLINYRYGSKRFEKIPDEYDLKQLVDINNIINPYFSPKSKMMFKGKAWGDSWRAGYHTGVEAVEDFFFHRTLLLLAAFYASTNKFSKELSKILQFIITSGFNRLTKLVRYMPQHKERNVGPLSGTLYLPDLIGEINVIDIIEAKYNHLKNSDVKITRKNQVVVSTQSANDMSNIPDNTIDYVFTDPPFGDNLMYSELNFILESWLRVFTNNTNETIINKSQGKDLNEYKILMTQCFREYCRLLKPNHWITVVFHNSKASVWNAIQDALSKAGFIIAQVTVLDKKKGTIKQVTNPGAVNNDLVINAYKPKKRFEEYFLKRAGEGLERDFVEEHLNHLPVEPNIERTEQMLFSKMLAHYVKHGFEIRLNAKQFYTLLRDNFKLIEGYWFTNKQVLKYEEWKKKQGLSKIKEIKSGYEVLFVNDEKSAIIWLYNFLETPQTYSDIYTSYSKATSNIEDKIPELKDLLSSNFIFEDKVYRRPKTEKEQEAVEEQREKDLSKAFEQILLEAKTSGKKLKEVRKEAISYGFTRAYQQMRFEDIVTVAKRLDRKILEENSEINDFVEIAQLKLGVEA